MPEFFRERSDAPKYEKWLSVNAKRGLVANRWRDGTVMRHHADCPTLTANRYTKTTPEYQKICALSLKALDGEVAKRWETSAEDIHDCQHCRRT